MTLDELKDYSKWIGKTADQVLLAVKAVGGWEYVFPQSVPRWASRIRNYFNDTPTQLKLVDETRSAMLLKAAQRLIHEIDCAKAYKSKPKISVDGCAQSGPIGPTQTSTIGPTQTSTIGPTKAPDLGYIGEKITRQALSGAVYEDQTRRIWFQMAAGGTIHHFGGAPWFGPIGAAIDASIQKKKGQKKIPIFKLISLDGTGGSLEVIITNPQEGTTEKIGKETIGEVDLLVDVSKRIVWDPVYIGTYNYSETIEKGYPEHEKRDVDPHEPAPDFYINPTPYSPLGGRVFPEKDPGGTKLADQK